MDEYPPVQSPIDRPCFLCTSKGGIRVGAARIVNLCPACGGFLFGPASIQPRRLEVQWIAGEDLPAGRAVPLSFEARRQAYVHRRRLARAGPGG